MYGYAGPRSTMERSAGVPFFRAPHASYTRGMDATAGGAEEITGTAQALIAASRDLTATLCGIPFAPPVAFIYNPLRYAREPYEEYLRRFGASRKRVVFLGMNPGPWGMAQTGVPFGDVPTVRDWLGIGAAVNPPQDQHPSRPVLGLSCPRVEVSGKRLWGLMRARFSGPADFSRDHFVANYCPLLFLEASGRNRTPDKLPATERRALVAACDAHLIALIRALRPIWLVGVGSYAASRIATVMESGSMPEVRGASIPHPSPASPRANAGWELLALRALEAQGIWVPTGRAAGT